MQPYEISRAKAEHVFTRTILHDLVAASCMQASNPVSEVARRAKLKLDAADEVGAKQEDQLFSQLYLHELETFWKGIREDVEARVSKGF